MIARTALAVLLAATPFAVQAQETKDKEPESWTLQEAVGDPDNLKISGSVRARYETLGNQFRPGLDENDDIVALRTTLFAEYDTGPVRIGGELIDARVYGADAGSSVGTGDVNAFELVQAYLGFDLNGALGSGSTTTVDVGRFTMDLGSRRLVGRNNFRNATNAFAGVKLERMGAHKSYLTAFYTLPLSRLPDDKASILDNKVKWDRESFDLTFWGGLYSKPEAFGDATAELYFYALNENDSPGIATRNRNLYSPGVRIYRDPSAGKPDYEFEGVYQFGNVRTGSAPSAPKVDVAAFFLHAELGYQFAGAWQPRVSIEYDRASGDKGGGDYNRFDSLYGVRRPDYGPTGIYGPLGRNNISSPGVRLEVKPDKRWDGSAMYRANWLDSATDNFAGTGVRDATGRSGKFGGHQIEGRVRYWIVPKLLRLDTGAAVLFNGRFLKDAPNANGFGDPLYGYLDLTATF